MDGQVLKIFRMNFAETGNRIFPEKCRIFTLGFKSWQAMAAKIYWQHKLVKTMTLFKICAGHSSSSTVCSSGQLALHVFEGQFWQRIRRRDGLPPLHRLNDDDYMKKLSVVSKIQNFLIVFIFLYILPCLTNKIWSIWSSFCGSIFDIFKMYYKFSKFKLFTCN